jgi:hypothetical protein
VVERPRLTFELGCHGDLEAVTVTVSRREREKADRGNGVGGAGLLEAEPTKWRLEEARSWAAVLVLEAENQNRDWRERGGRN